MTLALSVKIICINIILQETISLRTFISEEPCTANQLTGFYMRATLTFNGLTLAKSTFNHNSAKITFDFSNNFNAK